MGKVNASLADIKTERRKGLPEGEYEMQVIEIDESEKDAASGLVIVKSKVVDGASKDRQHWDYIYTKTKQGESNDLGWAQVKRYFEAIAPERANAADQDFDELKMGRFKGIIKEGTFKDKKTGQERPSSNLDEILAI